MADHVETRHEEIGEDRTLRRHVFGQLTSPIIPPEHT